MNLYDRIEYKYIQTELTLALLKRTMSVKVTNVRLEWNFESYIHDVRFEAIECVDGVLKDISASDE